MNNNHDNNTIKQCIIGCGREADSGSYCTLCISGIEESVEVMRVDTMLGKE
jgi:hypothetical protein